MPRPNESGWHGNQATIPQTIEGQAVATAHAGFFENVFQVNLDRSRTDPQFTGDFLVLEPLFNQLENLLLPRGQLAARIALGAGGIAEYTVLHPASSRGNRSQAGNHCLNLCRFSNNSAGAGLQKAQGLGFSDGNPPYDQ